jgi:hypothetical protein
MVVETKVHAGGSFKDVSQPEVNVSGLGWRDCVSIQSHNGAGWQTVWEAVAGDTIDLQDMFAEDEGDTSAEAICRLYGQSHSREGEQWFSDGSTLTYQNDVITPKSNTDNYQVKWDLLSGELSSSTTPEGVWESLDLDTFECGWISDGDEETDGSVTVSIRLGTGSVLDTAVWSGLAVSIKDEK